METPEQRLNGNEDDINDSELDEPAVVDTIEILDAFLPQPRRFDIHLWNGLILPGETSYQAAKPFCMKLNHPGSVRAMFKPPLELSLGEAYIHGDFDLEGDLLEAAGLMGDVFADPPTLSEIIALIPAWLRLPLKKNASTSGRGPAHLHGSRHSVERDASAIRYHYDVGNGFYSLWLDRRMQYSCAYFKSANDDLDTAQENKLEHICRKIMLKPGDRLLDIGCGWGGLAIYAAQKCEAIVTGITLSKEQHRLATEKVKEAGLEDKISIQLQDYRLVDAGSFDKVTSIGMAEHVGRRKLPDYFAQVYRLLKPGGLFLNHAISSRLSPVYKTAPAGRDGAPAQVREFRPSWFEKWFNRSILGQGRFQQSYFFPDGELEPVSEMNLAAEKAGFEVRDVEDLREHYAMTLEHWVNNMQETREKMVRAANEVTYRTWRLYMAVSAFGFRSGRSSIHQSLLGKPDGGRAGLPLTRDWMYAD